MGIRSARLIRRRLERDGVELSALRTDPAANTACAFVAYAPDGSRQFVFVLRDSAAARLSVADADVLLPSDGELETLGLPPDAAPIVCTTLGARGVDVAVGGRHELVPAIAACERDPTGAGDTFAAAFVVATLAGAEPVEAACVGAELAAVAVEHVGGRVAPVRRLGARAYR